MAERPILRFPDPVNAVRPTGSPRTLPKPAGPGRVRQGERFQATFDRLSVALRSDDPLVALRQDPAGIAPERALVFVTAGSVSNFAKVAREAGLEVFSEEKLEDIEDYPEGFHPAGDSTTLARTLYATIPTVESFQQMLSLWRAHQRGEDAPYGAAPWWNVFNLLLELRPWGPQDRLGGDSRAIIEDRLAFRPDDDLISIEFEIWPTASNAKRASWRGELEQRVTARAGSILDRSSIAEDGFVYEALLVELPCHVVREMLANPADFNGLATLEGVQFILPQTIGQALPDGSDTVGEDRVIQGAFDPDAPIRAALLDGTPVAAHRALDGGVVIEDMHELVRLSPVAQRYHATAMASLILRGDLQADGAPLTDTRLISVPVLIDQQKGAETASNRLFVDVVHTTLMRLIGTDEPAAPDVFVVNFSIGVCDSHFSGRISALARLMDWWAAKEGLLFVISAGNVGHLTLPGTRMMDVENAAVAVRRAAARGAMRDGIFDRTLLAPAESLNALTVGALSLDFANDVPPQQAGILKLEEDGEFVPQMTSALGLGSLRSIKPDLLEAGGCLELRAMPQGADVSLRAVERSRRTGLVAASPPGQNATQKSRGTSPAAALVTRSLLRAAEALTGEGGPYQGLELTRRQNALLTRALAVNAAKWPQDAHDLYNEERARLGNGQHARAKEEVCRHFGHGYLDNAMMWGSPETGVTMVGLGLIRKDRAQIFRMPVPPSLSGERLPRSMRVTLAWFSPVNPSRAQYRLAALEAAAFNEADEDDGRWGFDMTSDGLDANIIKRGSVWSRRLKNRIQTIPEFDEDVDIPIRVQCRDASGGGLSQDEDIMFAIVVTLQVEAEIQFDIHQEVEQALRVRLGQARA
ncbi:S8 family serine peptidase [Ectothiorhodospira variabilis]|uniref:S8 family serine peptidase n=1 Tax=Ectothiorhodospira variabilis TaxID=505694 RepID=UPI001EFBB122|nr:S8 family serine peptidase [Ectothiorhodospira variabilis]MCG5497161.1 S8 family serine peptidase [Ectothiorhodospira variabilis]